MPGFFGFDKHSVRDLALGTSMCANGSTVLHVLRRSSSRTSSKHRAISAYSIVENLHVSTFVCVLTENAVMDLAAIPVFTQEKEAVVKEVQASDITDAGKMSSFSQ